MISSGWRSSDGAEGRSSEQVCRACWEDDRAAKAARGAAARAALTGGSFLEQLRGELAAAERRADAAALARAAEFIDLLRAELEFSLPDDLLAWADLHRSPAA